MSRVTDDGLVEISDLDLDAPIAVGEWPEVSEMAIAADPDRWSDWHAPSGGRRRKPVVELRRVPADVGVR